jgi:hypothetical protein
LNDELLDHNDRVPPTRQQMEDKAQNPAFRENAMGLLREMDEQAENNGFDTWVWKDARLPLTLPFWVQIWEDPIYIITIRHPAEVALSSAQTEELDPNELPFSAGLIYWQYCMLNILASTRDNPKKIFIAYDQVLDDSASECTRLGQFLDSQCEKSIDESQSRIQAMVPHVARNQRHHQYGKSLAEMEQSTREQRALYNFLRTKVRYPEEAFREEDFALYPGWREYLQAMDMLLTLSQSYKAG